MEQHSAPGNRSSSLARWLMSNMAWAFGGKVLGLTSGLVVNALLARMLSIEDMAAYFLIVSITTFAAIIARLGLRQTVVRLVSESLANNQLGRVRRALKIIYMTVSIGVLIVGSAYYAAAGDWIAVRLFGMESLAAMTGLIVIWIATLAFQTPVSETFRGLHNIPLATVFNGVLASAILATALVVMWSQSVTVTLIEAVRLSVLAALASLLVGTWLFLLKIRSLRGSGTVSPKEVLSISMPVFVTNLAVQAMTNSSLWIVAAYLTAQETAMFGAAWKLVMLVAVPLEMMNMTIQPVIAELHTKNQQSRLQDALRGTATLAGIPSLIILLVYLFAGSEILRLAYGHDYGSAASILAILSVGQLVNVWTGTCGQVLVFTGHQQNLMRITLATGFITVSTAIIAAREWGLFGVAWAVTLGRIIQNVSSWYEVRRLTGLWTHATLKPSFLRMAAEKVLASRGRKTPD